MEIWLGGNHVFSETSKPEKPKESEPEKAAKRCARFPTQRNLQRYLKARRNDR